MGSSNQKRDFLQIGMSYSINQKQLSLGSEIFHYTSPEATFSILANCSLWASYSKFFLDKSEVNYAFSVLEESLSEIEIDQHFRTLALGFCTEKDINAALKKYGSTYVTNAKNNYYVVSFSTRKDDLFMWNSYTNTEDRTGYCISFNCDDLVKTIDAAFNFMMSGCVVYSRDEQKAQIKELLKEYDTWMKSSSHTEKAEEAICQFAHAFYYMALFYKKDCFAAENEYRIVIASNIVSERETHPITGKLDNTYTNYPMKLQYRLSGDTLTPYYALGFNKRACRSVMISPYNSKENSKMGLEHFLETRGLRIEAKISEIPF